MGSSAPIPQFLRLRFNDSRLNASCDLCFLCLLAKAFGVEPDQPDKELEIAGEAEGLTFNQSRYEPEWH